MNIGLVLKSSTLSATCLTCNWDTTSCVHSHQIFRVNSEWLPVPHQNFPLLRTDGCTVFCGLLLADATLMIHAGSNTCSEMSLMSQMSSFKPSVDAIASSYEPSVDAAARVFILQNMIPRAIFKLVLATIYEIRHFRSSPFFFYWRVLEKVLQSTISGCTSLGHTNTRKKVTSSLFSAVFHSGDLKIQKVPRLHSNS